MNYSFYTANELIEMVSTGQNQITASDDINSKSPDRINLPDEITWYKVQDKWNACMSYWRHKKYGRYINNLSSFNFPNDLTISNRIKKTLDSTVPPREYFAQWLEFSTMLQISAQQQAQTLH